MDFTITIDLGQIFYVAWGNWRRRFHQLPYRGSERNLVHSFLISFPMIVLWINSKLLHFSQLLNFSAIDLELGYFTQHGIPGDSNVTNFHHAESNLIWYTASLHHSLGLFFGFIPENCIFVNFWTFLQLIWNLDILRSMGYLATATSQTSTTRNRTKFGTELPYIISQDYF